MATPTTGDLRRFSREKQLEFGRGLRDGMPRRRLAELSGEQRRDPIAELAAQNKSRIPSLVPVRRERMSESPFAFYRGAAAVMAADLAGTATTGVLIQICGDAHLSNFGLFASRERALLFDVNDFDETAVGPWEWDVKRLVTSMAILGHDFGMSDDDVRQTATKTAAAYRTRINELAQMSALERFYLKTTALEVLDLVSRLSKSASKLATETVSKASRNTSHRALRKLTTTTVDGHYRIVEQQDIAVRVPEMGLSEAAAMVDEYFGSVPEDVVALLACHQFQDAVVRVVGVGSVGTRCYLALLTDADGSPLFLQMKEASASVVEAYFPQELRWEHGRRVVAGQRIMQASGGPLPRVRDVHPARQLLRPAVPGHEGLGGHHQPHQSRRPGSLRVTLCHRACPRPRPVGRAGCDRGLPGRWNGSQCRRRRVRRFRRGLFAAQSRGPAAATRGHRRGMAADILMS